MRGTRPTGRSGCGGMKTLGGTGSGGAEDQGPGTTPGQVRCGTELCTLPDERCCADPITHAFQGCVPSSSTCPGASLTCDEPGDCAPGEYCCLNRQNQAGPLLNVVCAPVGCIGPEVCGTPADCFDRPCRSFIFVTTQFTCH